MSFRRAASIPAVVVLSLAVAACGSSSKKTSSAPASTSSGSNYSGATNTTTQSSAAGGTELKTASGKLGKYLVDANGRSVYLFLLDKHGKSACKGPCLSAWPPVPATAGKPKAGPGVSASKISVITGTNGQKQLRYGKYPLYYYAGDSKPGDINGQGLKQYGAPWYLVRPTGLKYDTD